MCLLGSWGMFEETFPGVVGFLVANIKSGAEREIKTPLLRGRKTKVGLASSGVAEVMWRIGVLLQEPSGQKNLT